MKDHRGLLIIHLHVNDPLVFCDNDKLLQEFGDFINKHYPLKWTRKPTLYLGIKIDLAENSLSIKIYQSHYINMVLERFCMVNCKSARTPLPQKHILTAGLPDEIEMAKEIPYQQLVGCLQWIALSTRPEIAYAVTQLSCFNSAWTLQNWTLAKHVPCYLKGTPGVSITYNSTMDPPSAYSDSDFSQCSTTRCSITGQMVVLASGAVSWKSQRQKVVALSTTEDKYMASAECAKLISWVRSYTFDITFSLTSPSTMFLDNTSEISSATNERIKSRSKHIDRHYHFIHNQVQEGSLLIQHVPTTAMLAEF